MPFRLLEYEVAIIRSAIDKSKIKNKSYKIPLVMPIVLYTGKQKWNANKYLERSQEKIQGLNIKIGNYSLVDINNYTEKELLEDNTFISKMMLIEKSKNTEEIAETLEKIISKTQKEDKELLRRIIEIILEEKIGITKSKELIKKLEKGSDSMLAVVDMIRKENQMYIDMGRKEGKKEGKIEGKTETIKEIVDKMLRKNLPEKTIIEITGINPKEIEKIKNSKN
jgi:predicted transposase/invertase (TIGR01784 family)